MMGAALSGGPRLPAQKRSSAIPLIAGLIAVAVALAVAWQMFGSAGDSTTEGRDVASAPSLPTTTPQQTDAVPEADPTPAPTAAPTAAPTPEPTAAAVEPDPTVAPAVAAPKSSTAFTVEGRIHWFDSSPLGGVGVWVAESTGAPVRGTVRAAQETGNLKLVPVQASRFSVQLQPGKKYLIGMTFDNQPQDIAVEVAAGAVGDSVEVSLPAPRPFELRGVVLDTSRHPVQGITVNVTHTNRSLLAKATEPKKQTLSSGTDGTISARFLFADQITAGLDAESIPQEWLYAGSPVVIAKRDIDSLRSYRVEFQLTRAIEFTGYVKSSEGRPIEGATVQLHPLLPNEEKQAATTGAEGEFTFTRTYPAEYDIVVSHPKFNGTIEKNVDTGVERSSPLEIELSPLATVSGVAKRAPGAQVRLIPLHAPSLPADRTTADEEGNFQFANVRPGEYLVTAEGNQDGGESYAEGRISVTPDQAEVEVTLELTELGVVRGQLIGGSPEGGWRTTEVVALDPDNSMFDLEGSKAASEALQLASVIAGSGGFEIDHLLPGKKYLLVARNRETGLALGSSVAGAGDHDVKIGLNGTGTISGYVNAEDGTACAGAELRLTTGISGGEGTGGDIQTRRTVTDFEGRYEFPYVPAGRARLWLVTDEANARLLTVPAGKDVSISLSCRVLVPIAFDIQGGAEEAFQPDEHFLLIAQPGNRARKRVHEISYRQPEATLEPGEYIITRTSTMQSRRFEVLSRISGTLRIDFSEETRNY